MNILYIAPYLPDDPAGTPNIGGSLAAQSKIALVCSALGRLGHQVTLLSSAVTSDARKGWQQGRIEDVVFDGFRCTVVSPGILHLRPLGGLLNLARAGVMGRRVALEHNPDLVLCYNSYCFEYLAAAAIHKAIGSPVILEVEDLPLARRRGVLNIKPRLDQFAWPRMLRMAAASTAVSGEIYDILPADRPRMLFPGVISKHLLAASQGRTSAFRRNDPQTRVGYFGSISTSKGCDRLLDVIRDSPSGFRYVVSGSGPLAEKFAQYARAYPNRLSYLGVVPRVRLYQEMCKCDICVVPPERVSTAGAVFPFKVCEYLVSGSHVIASGLDPVSIARLDLACIQRWDGSSADFFHQLRVASEHFHRAETRRKQAVERIKREYSLDGVSSALQRLLEGVIRSALSRHGSELPAHSCV